MLRTIDYLTDLIVERGKLSAEERNKPGWTGTRPCVLRLIDDEMKAVDKELGQAGPSSSTLPSNCRAAPSPSTTGRTPGPLLLTVIQSAGLPAIHAALAPLFAAADAEFKLATTIAELQRISEGT